MSRLPDRYHRGWLLLHECDKLETEKSKEEKKKAENENVEQSVSDKPVSMESDERRERVEEQQIPLDLSVDRDAPCETYQAPMDLSTKAGTSGTQRKKKNHKKKIILKANLSDLEWFPKKVRRGRAWLRSRRSWLA